MIALKPFGYKTKFGSLKQKEINDELASLTRRSDIIELIRLCIQITPSDRIKCEELYQRIRMISNELIINRLYDERNISNTFQNNFKTSNQEFKYLNALEQIKKSNKCEICGKTCNDITFYRFFH